MVSARGAGGALARRPHAQTHIEQRWGTWFLNVASLSGYHMPITTLPISRLPTFEPGGNEVWVQCYLHTSQFAPQGWYEKAEKTLALERSFRW